jgi:hypothetical protein
VNAGEAAPRRVAFPWQETGEQLAAFAERYPGVRADRGVFAGDGARLVPPFVLPPPWPGEEIAAYRARLPQGPGLHCLVLLQAGAAALGYWDDDELLAHKAQKRYVVRGHGKAQPAHLKTRGKSRYGARLRLQNWRRLLRDVNARLRLWWDELGEPAQVLWSVPVRSVPELFAADPPPPLPRDDRRLRRIPLHVHVPDFRELLRVRARLGRGRLELPG